MPGTLLKFLLLAATFIPALAAAEQYKGYLIPGDYRPPIPIQLQLKFEGDRAFGIVRASLPVPMDGRVTGQYVAGLCNLTLTFNADTKANLRGRCVKEVLEGDFRIYTKDSKKQTGIFSLKAEKPDKTDKPDQAEKSARAELDTGPRLSAVDCIKRNTACLSGCPLGDYNTEFLCANTCRRKKLACQGKVMSARKAAAEAAAAPAADEEDHP